jgi:hypothetical protein
VDGVSVNVAGAVALAGVTANHDTFELAVTCRVPDPPLLTDTVCAAGLAAPWAAVNETVEGLTTRAGGGGGSTVSVTVIVFGEPLTPAAAIVTSAVYVPADSPEIDGVTVTVPLCVPLAGESDSHVASSLAVQFRVPPPVLVTEIVFAAGLAPPCVAENDKLAGEADNTGGVGGGSSVSVTGIVFGDPVAPAAVTVTSAV